MDFLAVGTFPLDAVKSGSSSYTSGKGSSYCQGCMPEDSYRSLGVWGGSGGNVYLYSNSIATGGSIVIEKVPDHRKNLAKLLQDIQSTFLLRGQSLYDVLKVTKKTYYNWINGSSEPRDSSLDRIFKLSNAVKEWKLKGLPMDGGTFEQPVLSGLSVIDLLLADDIELEKILFAGSRLQFIAALDEEEDSLF